jgi:hypothetical protein
MKKSEFDLLKFDAEFESFRHEEGEMVSLPRSSKIKSQIGKDLAFGKINSIVCALCVHLFAGFGVLAICPQFDIGIIENFAGLQHIFMRFGSQVCLFLCGALFLSVSIGVSALVLPQAQKRYLYSIRYFHVALLAAVSLLTFSIITTIPKDSGTALWFVGAVIFGSLSSKILITQPHY